MSIIEMIATPLMGAVIGYGTNYVAIKMLFRPLRSKYIGKFKIPFTPGIIPANRDRIANAVGEAVGQNLFTGGDIHALIMDTPIADIITDEIIANIDKYSQITVCENLHMFINDDKYQSIKSNVCDFVCEKIMHGIERADIANLIENEGAKLIKEKVQDTLFAMFMSDTVVRGVSARMGEAVEDYIDKNGYGMIRPIVVSEIENIEQMTLNEAIEKLSIDRDNIKHFITKMIMSGANYTRTLFEKLNVADAIKQKISSMDVLEIEKLVLKIMKRELNAIVNIGAILGLILGILTLFIK